MASIGIGLRTALVTGQLALAVVLLVGAGLLVRSLLRLQQTDLGYNIESVLTFEVNLAGERYNADAAQDQFFDALFDRLEALPGVVAVGGSGNIPHAWRLDVRRSPSMGARSRTDRPPEVGYQPVSDDLFKAMGVPLKRGRTFGPEDRDDGPPVVILSEGLARAFWPNGDAIGARIRLGPNPNVPWMTIVGIVGDVRMGVAGDARPTAYVSSRQDHWGGLAMFVRTTGDPMALLPAVRREVRALDATHSGCRAALDAGDAVAPAHRPASSDAAHGRVRTARARPRGGRRVRRHGLLGRGSNAGDRCACRAGGAATNRVRDGRASGFGRGGGRTHHRAARRARVRPGADEVCSTASVRPTR